MGLLIGRLKAVGGEEELEKLVKKRFLK